MGDIFPNYPIPPRCERNQDLCLTQCFLGPKSVYSKQNLDPFSRFCTAKPSKALYDRQTDGRTP